MEWVGALALLIGAIIALMAIGMPVAIAFLGANIIGAWVFMGGERGVMLMLDNGFGAITSFSLVPIPLFLLTDTGKLTVWSAEAPPTPAAGQRIISLMSGEADGE